MRSRQEIKAIAKANFQNNYGTLIGIIVVFVLINGMLGVSGVAPVFVTIPMTVGLSLHFMLVYKGGKPAFATMFNAAFTGNYFRRLGGMLWEGLFLWLWSLLLFIPGIIKAFSYAATSYILAYYPDVKAKDALKLSMRVMRGHKGELFVFMLSYIGWYLLSALTCGILALLYVGPYYCVAYAGFIIEVIDEGVRSGAITQEQLDGAPFA